MDIKRFLILACFTFVFLSCDDPVLVPSSNDNTEEIVE
jgi:hypothetical protein